MAPLRRGTRTADDPAATGADGALPPPPGGARSRRRYDPAWDDWKRPRRWPGILVSCLVLLGFLGVVAYHDRPHTPRPSPKDVSQPPSDFSFFRGTKPPFVIARSGVGAVIRTFHGTHNLRVARFTTAGGLLVMDARCACTYDFIVTLTTVTGTPVQFPVSATGPFRGTLNVSMPAGAYDLSVVASGPWRIRLVQPTAALTPIRTPFLYPSSGQSVIGPFSSSNRYLVYKFLSRTNGGFHVYVLNAKGYRLDDAYSGHLYLLPTGVTLPAPPNPFYVEVDAAGFWSLRVQAAAHR
jgi:hypothetical protein